MIKKLRVRFIALSMSLLFILLAVIMAAANLLNYRSVLAYSDSVLDILTSNGGRFPMPDGKYSALERRFSKELPYEARFFTVQLDSDGGIVFADTGKIAAVDTQNAIDYARKAYSSGRASGFIGDYRYAVSENIMGRLIVFLDCGRKLSDFYSFLLISGGISLAGYAIVFALTVFFSGRIVKPFSDNYEKQRRFITDAGHELKTPLSIIDADASVLELEGGESEWTRDIKKQTQRLASLTNALITLSRMEEENPALAAVEFPLSDVVEESAQSFQALAVAQGKSFAVDVQPMLSICGDEKAFRQLTSILLDNALKYSPEGGAVALSLKREGRGIALSVKNSSEPMSPESIEHMFDRFYRADKSRSSETGGYGIGLSIAKAIVLAHKGEIQASMPTEREVLISATFPG